MFFAACVTKTGPEGDIGSHSIRLAVCEAFDHVCLSSIIQCPARAATYTKAAIGAGIFSHGEIRSKIQLREHGREYYPGPETRMDDQVVAAEGA